MHASQLYELMIINPTWNVRKLRQAKTAGTLNLHTTPQQLGLRPERRLRGTDARQFDQQFELDSAMWYGAIITGPHSITLIKLFHIFYHAGVIYKTSEGWNDWIDNPFGNVASLLSHGQRVMVQIPSIPAGGDRLWTWLQEEGSIQSRGYATHGLSHKRRPEALIKGHRRYLDEKHGVWQSLKGHVQGRHYAFNVALGGEGNRNPFSRSSDDKEFTYVPIKADGLNGHVYINYMPPTNNRPGGMLVGCENAQHGAGTNPHTKQGHGLGGSQKLSACGGHKWSKLKCGPMDTYNGLICDLIDRSGNLDWLLSDGLMNPDQLSYKTRPVPRINQAPPSDLHRALAERRRAMGYHD
ncbi:hypothetical protein [Desulfosarcina ovata]|uniref:Novel toxin 11 domain-containing protein n=1 Tax=Desulfosarcina ovata subsp. ovata TaxID=2752305 RepID=A0A5K8A8A2_9BACT|nr:hypothetical protein [Desulfosarcina ovata]BBO88767.1 hypothetical protein DSCOOX_19470 [Desulfosarcina ovata subsp. ovata]